MGESTDAIHPGVIPAISADLVNNYQSAWCGCIDFFRTGSLLATNTPVTSTLPGLKILVDPELHSL